jgi:acetyl-CoA C-acetyltransferase
MHQPGWTRRSWAWARSRPPRCLEKAGWNGGDVDLIEINEAFAAQACAVNKELGWDTSQGQRQRRRDRAGPPHRRQRLPHPGDAAARDERRDAKKGLAALCIGGGMGVALAIER